MSVERLELRFKDAASVQKVLHACVNLQREKGGGRGEGGSSSTRRRSSSTMTATTMSPFKNCIIGILSNGAFVAAGNISALTFPT